MTRTTLVLVLLCVGCGKVADSGEPCEAPGLFFADDDGDGMGDPTRVYFGCNPPTGWVTVAGPSDTGADTGA